MKTAFLLLCALFFTSKLFAQKERELPFVLLIDQEIPIASITDGYFEVRDTLKHVQTVIPFRYQVGKLILEDGQYRLLMQKGMAQDLYMHFNYMSHRTTYNKVLYTKCIPRGWLNATYTILSVYNYFNKESRRRYVIPKKDYVSMLTVPGIGEALIMRRGPL